MPSGEPIPEEVREMLVELAADCLAERMYKSALKNVLREALKPYGDVSIATLERIISEGRELLAGSLGSTRDESRNSSALFYDRVVRDQNLPMAIRLKAQERLDKLLGLEAITTTNVDIETTAASIRLAVSQQDELYAD